MNERRIVLPWAVVIPDNRRHGLCRGRIILTAEYRRALEAARMVAAAHCRGAALTGDVHLRVDIFPPDTSRKRDILNSAKLICDALSGSAYEDDSQIARTEWVRQHTDAANPRVEIVVRQHT